MMRLVQLLPPVGFAVGYVMISFSATPTPLTGLPRPLLVAAAAALILAAVLALLTRDVRIGSILASALVVLASAMWLPVLIVACVALWIALVAILRRVTGRSGGPSVLSLRTAARVTAIFSIFFAVVSVVVSVPAAAGNLSLEARPIAAAGDESRPEIIVLLLDGYPRADVLADGFGFDNTGFEAALTEMGFDIKDESRSNYSATWPSLASVLNGEYLDEIPVLQPFPVDQTEQYQALSEAIDTSTLPTLLRAEGYEVAWVPGPFEDVALNTADRMISGGQLTAFELSLLRHSPLLPVVLAVAPHVLLEQHRDRIEHAFAQVPRLATADGTPTFAVVHVVSPHPPITFAPDGGLAEPAACLPDCSLWALVDEEQWALVPDQITHLNRLVLGALADAIAANPEAVLVVMSDHGTRLPDGDDSLELDNFTAVRLPNFPDRIPADVSLVNLLPELLNTVIETNLPIRPYRGWISASEFPLDMRPVE